MLRAGIVGCAIACASCAEPSRLDHAASGSAAEDPWATPPAKSSGDAEQSPNGKGDGKGALGGIDLSHALSTIADSMRKPGPYEAPEHSKDLDEARPHWGVLAR